MARRKKARSQEVPMVQAATGAGPDSFSRAYQRFESVLASESQRMGSPSSFLQSTWVYSAITFIAEHIMRTPQEIVTMDGKRTDDPELRRFINRPCSYGDQNTGQKFRYAYMFELLLNGAVMRLFGDMAAFKPKTMSVRPRWQFTAVKAQDDMGRDIVTEWRMNRSGNKRYYPEDNIFHDALYNPLHDFEGLAPLVAASLSILNDVNINEFANRFFKNDGSTGLVFTTDNAAFNLEKAEQAAKKWQEMYSGVENAFGVKFVGFGLKPTSVGTPLDAKMLQILRTFTKEEIISGVYHIPLGAISSQDSGGDIVIGGPSGGTLASANEAFLINCIMPWAQRHDEDFNRDVTWRFNPSVKVVHDFATNPILERRRLERARAAVELIDRGVPLNEIIRWLKLEINEQPHGDDWWVKNEMLPARIVLEAGAKAIEIAIPQKSPAPDTRKQMISDADGLADKRLQISQALLDEAIRLAQTTSLRESVRHDPEVIERVRGKTNEEVINDVVRGNGVHRNGQH